MWKHFMGPTWDSPGSCQPQMGPMNLAIRGIHCSIMMPYGIKYLCNITSNSCSGHVASPQRSSIGTLVSSKTSLITRLMGPTWGPSGADRTQVGPLLAPWTLLSGIVCCSVWYFQCDLRFNHKQLFLYIIYIYMEKLHGFVHHWVIQTITVHIQINHIQI